MSLTGTIDDGPPDSPLTGQLNWEEYLYNLQLYIIIGILLTRPSNIYFFFSLSLAQKKGSCKGGGERDSEMRL